VIGGRSIWGAIIEPLAKNYHWTIDYILWGISFLNVQMLSSDAVQVFYGSGKDGKGGSVISADNPANWEFIMNEVND